MSEFHDNYSWLDKALHYLAFKTPGLQLKLAAVESEEHGKAIATKRIQKPVFITALPRAGTTILLELLSNTGLFCYHSYRDMPFVYTPLLWRKFAGRFAKQDAPVERAHGDGIQINQQSPEAFEEMFYLAHFAEQYQGDSIAPWTEDINSEAFEHFFLQHIAKLMIRDDKARYLSKNNLNIARLGFLQQRFGDGCFVVPFREPLDHAMSLWRQHRNFNRLHQQNGFARDYMAGVGHFDFGENLKPVDFNHWLRRCPYQSDDVNFWLSYWLACYEALIVQPGIYFIGFEALCTNPKASLQALAEYVDIAPDALLSALDKVKPPSPRELDIRQFDPALVDSAQSLYRRLCDKN